MGKKVAPERDRRINHEMRDLGFTIVLYNGKYYWEHGISGQRIRLKNADKWLKRHKEFDAELRPAIERAIVGEEVYNAKNQPEREEQRNEVLHHLQDKTLGNCQE